MVLLIVTYYVFVYDPDASLRDHDGDELHQANSIDSCFLHLTTRSNFGTWYKIKLPKSYRDKLEKAFNDVSVERYCRDEVHLINCSYGISWG